MQTHRELFHLYLQILGLFDYSTYHFPLTFNFFAYLLDLHCVFARLGDYFSQNWQTDIGYSFT